VDVSVAAATELEVATLWRCLDDNAGCVDFTHAQPNSGALDPCLLITQGIELQIVEKKKKKIGIEK
jgi:hypothetical protein